MAEQETKGDDPQQYRETLQGDPLSGEHQIQPSDSS